jgi:hypothetical protein
MARTILVGDIHGCRDELDRLLDHVGFVRGDRLVSVGDTIVRGPDPRGTLDVLRTASARAVRGNHEDRLIRARSRGDEALGEATRATVKALRDRDWSWLTALPLWLDLPEHNVRVVHAGIAPGLPMDQQDPRALMYMRCIGPGGAPIERRGEALWGAAYEGPIHVVFGHNALPEPQIHPAATGIDTGAVYGGALTAMVLREGERPPPAAERRDVLVSIPARRRYAER